MKKVFLVLIAFLFCIGNLFCQSFMEIKIDKYSIKVPEGWIAQYTNSTNVFILYSPIEENDTFQENVNLVIEKLPTKYSVANYIKSAEESLEKVYGSFNVIEVGEDYHVISGTLNNTNLQQIQYIGIKDKVAYIMTYTSNPENYYRYIETFKTIQKTFTFD